MADDDRVALVGHGDDDLTSASTDDAASLARGAAGSRTHTPAAAASAITPLRRAVLTACLCGAFGALGMTLAMLGPALIDLAHQTRAACARVLAPVALSCRLTRRPADSTVSQLGLVFTARSFGAGSSIETPVPWPAFAAY